MDIQSIVQPRNNPKIPDFRPGDTVRVLARVVEGDRERVQPFEGVVIRRRRGGINATFTVRRIAHGVGVERTFMLHSPRLEGVQVVRVGRVRRSKLYYLRGRVGKRARIRAGSRDRFEALTRQVTEAEVAEQDIEDEVEAAEQEPGAADEIEVQGTAEEGAEEPAPEGAEQEPEAEVEGEAGETEETAEETAESEPEVTAEVEEQPEAEEKAPEPADEEPEQAPEAEEEGEKA